MNYWLTEHGLEPITLSVRDVFVHLFRGEVKRVAYPTTRTIQELLAHPLTLFLYCEDESQKRKAVDNLPREYGLFAVSADMIDEVVASIDGSPHHAYLITYIDKRQDGLVVHYTLINKLKFNALTRRVLIDEFLADNP